jgi:carbon monoxide dehydrogenase subunit G
MVFEQQATIAAPVEEVWEFLGNVPRMAECLPGLEDVREEDGGYHGALRIAVGPISVRLEGKMQLAERDRDSWTTLLEIEAEDRRIRSTLRAHTTMRLTPNGPAAAQLAVHTDAAVLGKLGQMGQAVLRRKSDQVLAQFVENMAAALSKAN